MRLSDLEMRVAENNPRYPLVALDSVMTYFFHRVLSRKMPTTPETQELLLDALADERMYALFCVIYHENNGIRRIMDRGNIRDHKL